MKLKVKVNIRKQSQPEIFTFMIVLMPFLFGLLFDLMGLPSFLKYVLDICWIGLLILAIINKAVVKENKIIWIWIGAFVAYTLVIYILRYQSALYYLWGFRNNFRFYAAFLAFTVFLEKEHIRYYLNLFDKLFWINAVVCFMQYYLLGKRGDFLGGLFGVERGCNGYTNIFFIIIAAKSIIYFFNKQESLLSCLLKCGLIMIISAYAELKFIYLEFAVIVVVAVVFTGFTVRKLLVALGALVGISLGMELLTSIFSHSSDVFSWEGMMENATNEDGYSSAGDINRLTAIPILSKKILKSFAEKMFGLGLGNCDTAGFEFLITPFYVRYSYLRYSWFSTAFTFLETGFVGLTLFFGFFVLIFILTLKKKCNDIEDNMYRQIAMVVSVASILFAIYGSSLRMESAYMVYFILAIPFIKGDKDERKSVQQDIYQQIG